MQPGGLKLQEEARSEPPQAMPQATPGLPDRDVRRKRPPVLSFLLRMETVRRLGRILTLLAIDFAGVFLAIFTAMCIKAALLFARSSLYASRGLRPGLPRIVGSLFQVAVVSLIFALISGERFSSYYI